MEQTYTENHILQYIYEDMEVMEYLDLMCLIEDHPFYKNTYREMKQEIDVLPKVSFSPSEKSLKMIMCYNSL